MREVTLDEIISYDKKRAEKRTCEFIKNKFRTSGQKRLIVGLSGGIDSSVCAKLLHKAVGSDRIMALFLPDVATPEQDAEDARALASRLGIELKEIPIDEIVTTTVQKLNRLSKMTIANIKVRTRMLIFYAFSNEYNGLVCGPSDRSEWLIGYFTKWGDGAADFSPIRWLYKTQVRALGRYLDLPTSIVEKKSSPALWEGQTARSELGMNYEEIDVILYSFFDLDIPKKKISQATGLSREKIKRTLNLFEDSRHKRGLPPSPSINLSDTD